MKRFSLASFFAAVLINAVTAVAWDNATQRLVAQSQARNASALVAQL